MENHSSNTPAEHLPVKGDHNLPYALSIIIAVMVTAASISGLLFASTIYPTEALLQTYVTNDVVNLVIGLPSLLVAVWFTRQNKLIGLLLWPGALLYVLYNYIAYIFGMPIGVFTVIFVALVLMSTYALFDLIRSIDKNRVKTLLDGLVPNRLSGGVLILFGMVFFFRAVGMFAEGIIDQNPLPISEIGVLIADIVLSVIWGAGGVMLFQRMPLGMTGGLGLLFGGCTLFIGLIIFMLLQPIFISLPLAIMDLLVVAVMGLICFIPFGLFARGILSTRK